MSTTDTEKVEQLAKGEWHDAKQIAPGPYTCGFCYHLVGGDRGYQTTHSNTHSYIRLCPLCNSPTFFSDSGKIFPASPPGNKVSHLPDDINTLYAEARVSAAANAPTASVLACRKILMHVAVQEDAKPGGSFISYIEHLDTKGHIPPRGKKWVDYIRKRANEANHDIVLMTATDATAIITLVEMLLRIIYEFPHKVPETSPKYTIENPQGTP
jgi:hypothetical protein